MFDFETFIKDNFQIKGRSGGGDYVLKCFFCGDEKHLWVNPSKGGVYHCFKCEAAGNMILFLMAYLKKPYEEILELIQSNISLDEKDILDELIKIYDYEGEDLKSDIFIKANLPSNLVSLNKANNLCKKYVVNKRNYSLNYLSEFNIKFCNQGKYYGNRLIIPIATLGHKTFQAYDVTGRSSKKQLNPKGVKKSYFIYLYNWMRNKNRIIITEGIFDALRLVYWGYPAVAILGKTLSEYQMNLLLKTKAKEVIFCLDKDANEEMIKQVKAFSNTTDKKVSYIELEDHKDPDEIRNGDEIDVYYNRRKIFNELTEIEREINLMEEFNG